MFRAWHFTYFPDGERRELKPSSLYKGLKYGCWCWEECPSTGRWHWQGTVYWKNAKDRKNTQKCLGIGKAHCDPNNGSMEQNRAYCVKSGDFEEFGEMPKQGDRSDIHELRDAAKRARNEFELIEDDEVVAAYAKYPKFAEKIMQRERKIAAREHRDVEVIVHWGETGTGKSHGPDAEGAYKWNPCQPEWWPDYDGEEVICIDEFYGQVQMSRMLVLLDKYICVLPIKNGHTYAKWKKVYITSNMHPDDWYKQAIFEGKIPESKQAAFKRRITKVIHFSKPFGSVV